MAKSFPRKMKPELGWAVTEVSKPLDVIEIYEILDRAALTGEPVAVTSAFGSTPGLPVLLHVREVVRGEEAFRLQKAGSTELSTYRVNDVLWVDDSSGIRFKNPAQITAHEQSLQRIKTAQAATDQLRSTPVHSEASCEIEVIQEMTGTENGVRRTFHIVKHASNGRVAVVHALSGSHAKRICRILFSSESVWRLTDVFLTAEFYWPAWIRYHSDARVNALLLRNGRPRLREAGFDLNQRGNPQGQDQLSQEEIYSESKFLPNQGFGVTGPLRFFESDEIDYRLIFELARKVHLGALRAYLAKAWASNELFELEDDLGVSECILLRHAQLTIPARDAPIEVLARRLNAGSLYAPLKARKIKLPEYGFAAYRKFYATSMSPDFERELRGSAYLKDMYVFLPPAPWSWEQFQDFRYCYVLMIESLRAWLRGDEVGPTAEAYYLKLV